MVPLNVVPVGFKPPTPLSLLSVTIAVIMALPKLETVSGAALSSIAAGGPALMLRSPFLICLLELLSR